MTAVMCEWCDRTVAVPQRCAGDGAHHRHGAVHTVRDGLRDLCGSCGGRAAQQWDERRAGDEEPQ